MVFRGYLVRVITKVVTLMSVPSKVRPNDNPGGMLHDERALLALGST